MGIISWTVVQILDRVQKNPQTWKSTIEKETFQVKQHIWNKL